MDDAVASIIAELRAIGELDNTLILFTSDNGFFHGEHRIPTGKVLRLRAVDPGAAADARPRRPARRHARQLVSNADLSPTILAAAHATPGRLQDGRSLLDLIRDPRVEWGRELLLESGNPRRG